MRKFIERALEKFDKLGQEQLHALIYDLAAENDRMEAVLASLSDGILVADAENNLVMFNKGAERLVPLTGSEGYDGPIWKVISDVEIAVFVEETLTNKESVRDREFTLDVGGMNRILSFTVTPFVRSGHIQGTLIHVEDVSEKRSREARLRRVESLASLTTLAAGVAHEIKNPLGSIGIHMQLLQKLLRNPVNTLTVEDAEHMRDYVDVVNEEVERLNRIVVDFLFAVRPMDVELIDQPLNPIVRELLDFVQFELAEANVEIVEELSDDLPLLRLDDKFVKQALLNLVKNAISAMPKGGTLTVSTERRGDEVMFRLSDTGVGMSEEIVNKIFQPYFTTKDFGSGIGLTVVYKVVKEHMGDISVVSHVGKGSSFTITFPVPQLETHLLSYKGADHEV